MLFTMLFVIYRQKVRLQRWRQPGTDGDW